MNISQADIYECKTSGQEIFDKDLIARFLVDAKIYNDMESVKSNLPKEIVGNEIIKESLKKREGELFLDSESPKEQNEVAKGIVFLGYYPRDDI